MSKIKDVKEKHPEFIIDVIEDLSSIDPSGNNKYLPFYAKILSNEMKRYFSQKEYLNDICSPLLKLVADFHKYCELNIIENKDIYSYKELDEIESAIQLAQKKDTTRAIKYDQTLVLYEDNEKIVVKCLTQESSIMYGKNTKWCTSALNDNMFHKYATNGTLVYVIFKSLDEETPNLRKVAFNKKHSDSNCIIWNSKSEEMNAFDSMKLYKMIGEEIMDIINYEIEMNIPNILITKDNKGKLIANTSRTLIDSKTKENVQKYVDNVTDKRLKNKCKTDTFDPSTEIAIKVDYGNNVILPIGVNVVPRIMPIAESGLAGMDTTISRHLTSGQNAINVQNNTVGGTEVSYGDMETSAHDQFLDAELERIMQTYREERPN